MTEGPYIVGLSWQDAVDFCAWLSQKEGKTYRLPTEAEWEYSARAGTNSPFWSGDRLPSAGEKNPWGLANVHSGPLEWCLDWYGPYPKAALTDPRGPDGGITKVIRGGGLDKKDAHFARSANRASYGASFAMLPGTNPLHRESEDASGGPLQKGLIGVWYGTTTFTAPKAVDHLTVLDINWHDFQQPGEDRETQWSALWEGILIGPATGEISFYVASDYALTLTIDEKKVVHWDGEEKKVTSKMKMQKDRHVLGHAAPLHSRTFRVLRTNPVSGGERG